MFASCQKRTNAPQQETTSGKQSRDSVQSDARIKAELALCLLRGEVSARLGDVVDTATRLLDRQHRCPGCRIDVQRGRLCRVGPGSGAVQMPIAEDDSVDWRRGNH